MPIAFLRSLRKTPGPSSMAILALGVGLGATLALFALLDRLLFHPLPYPDLGRLCAVWIADLDPGHGQFSGYSYKALEAQPGPFEAVGAMGVGDAVLQGTEGPQPLRGVRMSGKVLSLLGVRPQAGRLSFTPEEDRLGGPGAVILTGELWRSQFGADPRVLGRSLQVDGRSCAVVGILPEGFRFPTARLGHPQIILPIGFRDHELLRGAGTNYEVVGRLKPGFSPEQASPLLAAVDAGLEPGRHIACGSLAWSRSAPYRERLGILAGAVGLLLAAVCANACGLLLARFEDRKGILALQGLLGAPPLRLGAGILGEGVVFGLLGALLGLLLDPPLRAFLAAQMGLKEVPPQAWWGPLAALGLAVLTGLLAALPGAFQASRSQPMGALQGLGGRTSARTRSRKVLIALELAMSFLLLTGAGTLLGSLWAQWHRGPGFDPAPLQGCSIPMPSGRQSQAGPWARRLAERLQEVPGVEGVFVGLPLPLFGPGGDTEILAEGGTLRSMAFIHCVEGDFRGTLGLRLLEGRSLSPGERDAVVISRPLAQALFQGRSALGRILQVSQWRFTVAGVVEGTRVHSLEEPLQPQVFLRVPPGIELPSLKVVIRSRAGVGAFRAPLREALKDLDPQAAAWDPVPFTQVLKRDMDDQRRVAYSLGLLAGVSALLAGLGLYGLLSQLFRLRRREMGIRAALGATPGNLSGQVAVTALGVLLGGLSCGLLGALALGRLLGHGFSDAAVGGGALVAAGLFLVLGTALACLGPALGAARAQPSEILREG